MLVQDDQSPEIDTTLALACTLEHGLLSRSTEHVEIVTAKEQDILVPALLLGVLAPLHIFNAGETCLMP